MKVDNHQPMRPDQTTQGEPARKTQETPSPQRASDDPASMTHLRHAGTDTSQDIDAARVDELRDAIREGRLEIHPERIADGLIASVQDLLVDGDSET
ncbi:flagellar biosynthesis anti-sigma factor FlgM [Halomonas sabkhae]|uniref:flagellar biosynthesis anti-sigma factor FlgM n=1 Tax=Halomonas sabkhae TaxID=626223 RepID=UPI0025B390B7|nr:flagellar biosynthesis anti-sigma factor FlgM [Halomonas sabkhae]MDN3524903.1 flagellar biosynthesis anti-sigma factor FlgM [Halomonas sabkhae]